MDNELNNKRKSLEDVRKRAKARLKKMGCEAFPHCDRCKSFSTCEPKINASAEMWNKEFHDLWPYVCSVINSIDDGFTDEDIERIKANAERK